MRYFFHYFLVIPTNFRHSFGHPQNETPHKHRAQPSRNALFFRSTAPLPAKCSAAPETAAKHKDRLPNVPFSRRSSVAPAGVEPTMGESKSPALPLGDGASCKILYHILCFSTRGRFHFSAFTAALCRLFQPAICEKPIFFIITTKYAHFVALLLQYMW